MPFTLGVGQSPRSTALTITVSDVMVFRGPPGIRAFIARCASGVLPSSCATGVGHKPEPVAAVRGANGRSRDAVPLRVIPARGQVSENSVESSASEGGDVLHDDVAGSKLANEPREVPPKTRAFSVDPRSLSRAADVLAGETSAEDIDWPNSVGAQFSHIGVAGHSGPMLGEDTTTESVALGLPHDSHACAFETEVESSDAAEQ